MCLSESEPKAKTSLICTMQEFKFREFQLNHTNRRRDLSKTNDKEMNGKVIEKKKKNQKRKRDKEED